jgi:starch synthase/alpha-amylase
VQFHNLNRRVAICDFDERLARLAYGASDFVMMPSRFEPCGLPQMIGRIYGSLPVAHDTGGIHDTITHMDVDSNAGTPSPENGCIVISKHSDKQKFQLRPEKNG